MRGMDFSIYIMNVGKVKLTCEKFYPEIHLHETIYIHPDPFNIPSKYKKYICASTIDKNNNVIYEYLEYGDYFSNINSCHEVLKNMINDNIIK